MSRLPSEAASRNMSACSAQAMSQVGCRLMVASSANTSLPFAPARCGDIALAWATKAAMSSAADGLASGSGPALRCPDVGAEDTSPADLGLIGSPAMIARQLQQALCGTATETGQCAGFAQVPVKRRERAGRSVLERRIGSDRPGAGHRRRILGHHRPERTVVCNEFVEHVLDRRLRLVGAGIAHIVMLEAGIDHRDPRLLALRRIRDDARVR